MKRLGFWILPIFLFISGCGGGGGSSTPSPTPSTSPTVLAFTMPSTALNTTVAVSAFTISNADSYLITSSSTPPAATDAGWSTTKPTSFTLPAAGTQTAYAWAKDSAGNVSQEAVSATVTITVSTTAAMQVTGTVINPNLTYDPTIVNGNQGLAATVVSAYTQPSAAGALPAATATTDQDGNFIMTGLLHGQNYYFTFVRSNAYSKATYYNIVPDAAHVTVLGEKVKLMPLSSPTDISGYVRNVANYNGVSGMTVKLRAGINPPATDPVLFTTTTNTNGDYTLSNVPLGTYTAEVTGNIGSTAVTATPFRAYSINSGSPISQDVLVSTGFNAITDSYRVVLSWGDFPPDLDLHLTGPLTPTDTTTQIGVDITPLNRFHIGPESLTVNNEAYPYGSYISLTPTIPRSDTDAYRDMDQTNHGIYNGSETIVIRTQRKPGDTGYPAGYDFTYKFYVSCNIADNTVLAGSGAQVKVYKGAVLKQTFNVPSGSGTVWTVFELNGDTITAKNTLSTTETYNLAKRVTSNSFDEYFLFKNLPIKK